VCQQNIYLTSLLADFVSMSFEPGSRTVAASAPSVLYIVDSIIA
jgi:hypothetical protein